MHYGLAAVNPETGEDDRPWAESPPKTDETIAALGLPGWVPALTAKSLKFGETADGTYVSVHDYVLAVRRADQRQVTGYIGGALIGVVLAYILSKVRR